MNAKQEKDIIRTLVKAGNESLAKTFARSRGYKVRGSSRVSANFDPKKAMIYFEINLSELDMEEDEQNNPKQYQAFLKLGNGDPTKAALKAEDMALKETMRLLKSAKIGNEGHDRFGALVCKISVNSVDEAKQIFERVEKNRGGGDDIIYMDRAPYAEASNFVLYPNGVNSKGYNLGGNGGHGDVEDYLEEA